MVEVRLMDLVVTGPIATVVGHVVRVVQLPFSLAQLLVQPLMGCSGILATGPIISWVDLFVMVLLSRHTGHGCANGVLVFSVFIGLGSRNW